MCWRGADASCGCDATGGDCACGCPIENAVGALGVAKAGVDGADVAVLLRFVLGPKRLSMSSIAAARCGVGEEDVLVAVAEGSAPKIFAKMSSLLVERDGLGADGDETSSPRRSAYGGGEYNCQCSTYNVHP